MKKILALVLCLALSVSLFAACGKDSGGLAAAESTAAQTMATIDANSEEAALQKEIDRLAAEGKKLVLEIGLPANVNVEDYDTNAYTLWLEEQTGYDLQFTPYQSNAADYKASLSTALAGGDELPDILWNFNVGQAAYEEYGAAGYFVDMAPYYYNEELSSVFWDRLAAIPDVEQREYVVRQLIAEDQGMYAFARIEYSLIDTMQYQVYINQTWLDKLNLEMPTDFASLKKVLIAFRDGDPNGNGKKDELPLVGSQNASSSHIVDWIINMFTYVNPSKTFNVDANGKLYLPHTTDKYRQALIEIRSLIKEGLMFNSAFSMSNKEIKSLLNPPEGEAITVGVWAGHPTLVNEVDNSAIYNYVAMPYWGYCNRSAQAFTPATFITQDCEYPLAAWKLFMVMCSEEGSFRQRYGEKGTDWIDADPNTMSFINKPAELKVINEAAFGTKGNCTWGSIQGTILVQAENEVCQLTEDMGKWVNKKMENMGQCYFYYVDGENANRPEERENVYPMPELVVPVEVSESDVNERTNVSNLISEAISSFCCGTGTYNDPTNDAQWNQFLTQLEELGYKTWMEHRQRVMDVQFPDYVKTYVHEEVLP